jgi:hypothetical protein
MRASTEDYMDERLTNVKPRLVSALLMLGETYVNSRA